MRETKRLTLLMIVVFIVITMVWLYSYFFIKARFGCPSSPSDLGQIFGAVGALFSGWAFCGVLWAILLQRKAIEIQQKDLEVTLAEMNLQSHIQTLTTLINVFIQDQNGNVLHRIINSDASLKKDIEGDFTQNLKELILLNKELRKKREDEVLP